MKVIQKKKNKRLGLLNQKKKKKNSLEVSIQDWVY